MKAAEPSLPEQVREALERFTALSECAVRACAAQDSVALIAAIEARELVTVRLRHLGASPTAVLVPAEGESRSARAAREAVPECARAAARANQNLVRHVGEARDDLARQLERLNHDESAVAGYARAMPRQSLLDLRR